MTELYAALWRYAKRCCRKMTAAVLRGCRCCLRLPGRLFLLVWCLILIGAALFVPSVLATPTPVSSLGSSISPVTSGSPSSSVTSGSPRSPVLAGSIDSPVITEATPQNPPLPQQSSSAFAEDQVPSGVSYRHIPWYDLKRRLDAHANQQVIAKALGWVPSPLSSADLCKGYYQQPEEVVDEVPAPAHSNLPLTVTSTGPTSLLNDGRTVLRDHIVASEQGRITRGDRAILYRNKDTGKLERIEVFGHVRYVEKGRLLLGSYANINLVNKHLYILDALYHFQGLSPDGQIRDSWGTARRIDRLSDGILVMDHANYTTCSPLHHVWRIYASKISINKKKGWGKAHQVIIKVKRVPVFYSPYISFPIDHRRKSGFLAPIVSHVFSVNHGTDVTVPYYWNMAPNYDMLISPDIMTRRSVLLNDQFRYLTLDGTHTGQLNLHLIPYDTKFSDEIAGFSHDFANKAAASDLNALQHMSSTRAAVSYVDSGSWGSQHRWHSGVDINYLSDPYFLQDFSNNSMGVQANQLLNDAQLNYNGNIWQTGVMAQGYQTLHLINQPPAQDQYWRLPEVDSLGFMPHKFLGLDLALSSQVVNFAMQERVGAPNFMPIGERMHLRPGVLYPITLPGVTLLPQFWEDNLLTQYSAAGVNTPLSPTAGQSGATAGRSIPMVGFDADSYFESSFHLFHLPLRQTLRPHLFYLYVPFVNQDKIPVFDTQPQTFSYDRLDAMNQFSGFDRLQNANQLSISLSTSTINGRNGAPLMTLGNGMIWYFANRRVNLSPLPAGQALPLDQTDEFSPFVSELTFNPGGYLSLAGNSAIDMKTGHLSLLQATLTSRLSAADELSAGYNFVFQGDVDVNHSNKPINLQQAYLGINIGLGPHLKLLAYGNYSFSRDYPITSYAGLEYNSCCWALRTIVSHDFNHFDAQGQPQIQNSFFVQIELNGLGSVGKSAPTGLLSLLPGYVDHFHAAGL